MCNCGGTPDPGKSKLKDDMAAESSQVRKTTSRRCECEAHIVLKAAGLRGFVIMSFVEDHNHPLAVGAENMFLRCNRKVSKSQQNFIMDCSRAKIGATRAYNLAKEMVGSYENVGATVSDFKNFARDVKLGIGENDASLIIDKFKLRRKLSKDKFYYDYKTDREGHLTGLFWTDAISQANYEIFGDIVSFDPTFRTNKYNMVFVPFTGVDNHWKNVTFGASLIAKEDYKNFKWLINTFKRAMGHAPTCAITDQCPAIKKALQISWPHTKHRLCMWHIMNKLPSKLGPRRATDKVFMSKLKSVVYSDQSSPLEFEEGWSSVISEYKWQDNKWMSDMFRRRKSWIPAYFSDIDMAGLLRTTSRYESSNSFFQHFHERGDTLVEFYSSFESAMDKQRIRTVEDDKNSRKTPRMETPLRIEKDAARVYTLALYYRVREEIKNACFHTSMPEITQTDDSRVFMCKDEILNGKIFQVSVKRSTNDVECSCKFFNRYGYLCCHAFAALQQCGIHTIPRQFIKARWTKDALKNHTSIGSLETPSNCDKPERTKIKLTRAWFEFESCLDLVGDDEDKLDMVRLLLRDMESKLQNDSEQDGEPGQAHRADAFIGPLPLNEEGLRNPNISKNKGSGSRIKSTREIFIQSKGQRTCSICNKTEGHNARTCPTLKK
ncbi:hypothetical protein DCAR_0833237 [Daucus carota subsp. sativus]|uniref:SWIM-type domain-containing protein n=2 Tax=Daucus carota subsp. sativus TaxID=79200 RepID=A0AAF0XWH6_DAUCS|nr:hypothetical protein DCAR_0833237 [Daucus carota subsp. sativus]